MKEFWKSRTLWLHGVVAAAPFLPFVHQWVSRDPIHVMQYHAVLAFVLRFDTREPIGSEPKKEE